MKIVAVLIVASLLTCGAAQAASLPTGCAFGDERVATLFLLYTLAAEHYVTHRKWPSNSDDLLKQYLRVGKQKDAEMFFARFQRITLRTKNYDLHLDVRLRDAELIKMQKVILRPGKSAEDILGAATYPNAA